MYEGLLKIIQKANAENTLMFSDVINVFNQTVAPKEANVLVPTLA